MNMNTTVPTNASNYSIEMIKDEIQALVERGFISRKQAIYSLAKYIPPREWLNLEKELELEDFLLRDRIADLLSTEKWDDD